MLNGMQCNSLPNKTDFRNAPSANLAEFRNAVFGFEPAKQLRGKSHLKHKRHRIPPHLGGKKQRPLTGARLLGIFLIALSCQSLTPSSQDGPYRKCHKPKCQQRLSLDLLINTRLEHFNANVYHKRNVSFYWIARKKKNSIILKGHQNWFPSHWVRLIIDVTILDFKSPPKTAKLDM